MLEYGETEEDRNRIVETRGEEFTVRGQIKIANTKKPREQETDEGVQCAREQIKGVAWETVSEDTNTWKREQRSRAVPKKDQKNALGRMQNRV